MSSSAFSPQERIAHLPKRIQFTDGELNCQADLEDYRRGVEEFYLEYLNQMDEQTREKFRRCCRGR